MFSKHLSMSFCPFCELCLPCRQGIHIQKTGHQSFDLIPRNKHIMGHFANDLSHDVPEIRRNRDDVSPFSNNFSDGFNESFVGELLRANSINDDVFSSFSLFNSQVCQIIDINRLYTVFPAAKHSKDRKPA